MDNILFEIPVNVAVERINLTSSNMFSYLFNGVMNNICITDTMRTVAKNPKCCFCGAEATKAFVFKNGVRLGIKFFTEKNGELILFTKDHRIPKSQGGKDKLTNYQTACEKCNRLKGDITKDNEIAKAFVALKSESLERKKEITCLKNVNDKLRVENACLEQEIYELYSLRVVRLYFFLKKNFSNFIDKFK